ncbi:MAG: hypothetical protein DMF97_11910 [Acidobacteria bacterium]|nr:MAG: hypothetical protein DMF97_11910 [Acidobacteriota bacterium]
MQYLRETPPPETRTEILTPATDQPASFALSPDGRQIVFVARGITPHKSLALSEVPRPEGLGRAVMFVPRHFR